MSRTFRQDNGLNKGRDDKPYGSKCLPTTSHPKGYDTFQDDHGHYGAGGSRSLKRQSHRAARIFSKNITRKEINIIQED